MEVSEKQVSYSNLPLAIYLEIAAHLEQVSGITVQIIPENKSNFAYHHSQARGIIIKSIGQLNQDNEKLIESILGYYASLYGGSN